MKNVLDAQTGAGKTWSNALLSEALKEAKTSGWIRFAAQLPPSFGQEMQKMGDSFQPFAAVQIISGSVAFEGADGSAATFDLKMRTPSTNEASQLENHLKSLVFMGKAFLGDNKDPQMQAINQVLDRVEIGAQANNVSLSISLSKELMGLFNETKKKAPAIIAR